MKCVKVSLKDAEKTRKKLVSLEILDNNYSVGRDENFVYFPVLKLAKGFNFADRKLISRNKTFTFEELLKEKLSSLEISLMTKSFDVVGNIAIIEVDEKLIKKKKFIANCFLESNKNIKTVIHKIGGHVGKYRIQKYEFLAGKKTFETIYRENGVVVKFDISKTYFSPRSSNERLRIANLVKKNEDVLVMFSGIGIYSFVISKHSRAREIYCVEMNSNSCKYAKESLKLNKLNNIKLFCGDVKKVVPKLKKKFDRIIMPLPETSFEFLELGLNYLKKNGIIHLYTFATEEEIKEKIKLIKTSCKCKILRIVKAGQRGPHIFRFCIDFKLQ